MQDSELETSIYRLKAQIAASRVFAAGLRLQLALKQNPNWHLQPRVPIGDPIEVHRRVSARMSMRDKAYNFNIRRFGIEKRTFAEQYDDGLDLVREILEDYGYDPSDF